MAFLDALPRQPPTGRFLAPDACSVKGHCCRALPAHPLAEEPKVPTSRMEAHVEEAGLESGRRCADDEVTGQRHIHAGPESRAVRTAATVGSALSAIASKPAYIASSGALGSSRSSTEPPAQKTGPADATTSAPALPSAWTAATAPDKARVMAQEGGRLAVRLMIERDHGDLVPVVHPDVVAVDVAWGHPSRSPLASHSHTHGHSCPDQRWSGMQTVPRLHPGRFPRRSPAAATLFRRRRGAVLDGSTKALRSAISGRRSASTACPRLDRLGPRRAGDRVAGRWAPNSADWVVISFAAYSVGAALVPLDTRDKGEEAGQRPAHVGSAPFSSPVTELLLGIRISRHCSVVWRVSKPWSRRSS